MRLDDEETEVVHLALKDFLKRSPSTATEERREAVAKSLLLRTPRIGAWRA